MSELVTNAVKAQVSTVSEIGVRFAVTDGRLRLEVQDASDELPVVRKAEEDEECGRGLWLVDALASGWGVEERGDIGKVVWAELAVSEVPAAHRPPPTSHQR